MTEIIAQDAQVSDQVLRPEVAQRIDSLPSLSNVVGEFLEMSADELVTAKDFERVICKDQALVARLLKTANSGKYGKSRSINSISDAVVLIGLNDMKKIVYAVSSEGLLRQDFAVYRYPGQGFWMYSLGVATAARILVEAASKPTINGEAAFVSGLVHDVGKLIIDDFLDTEGGVRRVALADEVAVTGVDHAELGAHIMGAWNIPEVISGAARWHHDLAGAGDICSAAAAIGMGAGICDFWGVGTEPFMNLGEDVDPTHHEQAMEALGIPDGQLEPVLFEMRQKLAGLEEMFGN
ncbi:MAG: HDOD domain-containing protein [bacterium]|nr:HDOD domain-containing protein [bacterium]